MKKLLLIFICIFSCGFKYNEATDIYTPQKGVYVVEVDTSQDLTIESYVSKTLESVEDIAKKTNAIIVINGGFFDPNNCKTISFIAKDSKIIANPVTNVSLVRNFKIKPYLAQILNRSEIRFYKDKTIDIVPHATSSHKRILHSIQAGPLIYPELKFKKEAFVAYKNGKIVRHAAGVLYKKARSLIGYKDNHLFLVVITNENPMTLEEASKIMQKLGVKKAMAFDGGSSTSLYIKDYINITSAKNYNSRKIKSALIIK